MALRREMKTLMIYGLFLALASAQAPNVPKLAEVEVVPQSKMISHEDENLILKPRKWKSVTGGEIEGTFDCFFYHFKKIRIKINDKEFRTIEIDKLSEEDRKLLDRLRPAITGIVPTPTAAGMVDTSDLKENFLPEKIIARNCLPDVDYSKLNITFENSREQALVEMLLWWDAAKVIEIPKAESLYDKVKSAKKSLGKIKNDYETAMQESINGFFESELKGKATVRAVRGNITELDNFSIARLVDSSKGSNAVFLTCDRYDRSTNCGSNCFFVIEAKEDGNCVLRFNGKNIPAVIKVDKTAIKRAVNEPDTWTVEFSDLSHLVKYTNADAGEMSWKMLPRGIMLCAKPYFYKKTGLDLAPPADDLFDAHKQELMHVSQYTIKDQMVLGSIIAADPKTVWFVSKQKFNEYPSSMFSEMDMHVWRAKHGQILAPLTQCSVSYKVLEYKGLNDESPEELSSISVKLNNSMIIVSIYNPTSNIADVVFLDRNTGVFTSGLIQQGLYNVVKYGKFDPKQLVAPHKISTMPHGADLEFTMRDEPINHYAIKKSLGTMNLQYYPFECMNALIGLRLGLNTLLVNEKESPWINPVKPVTAFASILTACQEAKISMQNISYDKIAISASWRQGAYDSDFKQYSKKIPKEAAALPVGTVVNVK